MTVASDGLPPVRVVVWGMGRIYCRHLNVLLLMRKLGQVQFVAGTAKDLPAVASIDGFPIVAREEVARLDYDLVLVMMKEARAEILRISQEFGIPQDKLATYQLLQVPCIDLRLYLALRRRGPSIVSNNCWGGFASSTLELQVRSPLGNMTMSDADYMKLVGDLQGYLTGFRLEYEGTRVTSFGDEYPVMRLGELHLNFIHDQCGDASRIVSDWERRLSRFNWDDVIVVMVTTSPGRQEELSAMPVPWRRLCLVPFDSEDPTAVTVPMLDGKRLFCDVANEVAQGTDSNLSIDLVRLLLELDGWNRCNPTRSDGR